MYFIYWIKKNKIDLIKTGLKPKEKTYKIKMIIINNIITNQSNFKIIPWN